MVFMCSSFMLMLFIFMMFLFMTCCVFATMVMTKYGLILEFFVQPCDKRLVKIDNVNSECYHI